MAAASRRLVVVGASLAGLRAVEAARKIGHRGPIVLIGAETHLPYDRPPLSKAFLEAGDGRIADTCFREEAHLRDELGVELMLGRRAVALDADAQEVVLEDDQRVAYDVLVIATGASARTLPGTSGLSGVQALRTLDDALSVREALDRGARTVIVGAGFIGSELASSAAKRGVPVQILEALPTPLVRAAGPEMGAALASIHARHGTRLRCGAVVESLEGEGRVERVRLQDGTTIDADLVVVGIGVTPNVEWLAGSGVQVADGVVCDETLWTGIPGVYAAGDVASWPNPALDGQRQRMENWTAAAEQGAAAARNALDPSNAKPYGTVPYFWSDWYDVRIQFVGDPAADEVVLVEGDLEVPGRWVALYRRGDRLIGALTVQGQTEIMKYRGLIARGATWDAALAFAAERRGRLTTAAAATAPA